MLPIGNGFLVIYKRNSISRIVCFLEFSLFEGKNLSNCTCINFLKTLRSIFYFFLKILSFYRERKHVPLTIMPRVPLVYVNKTIVRSETFSISIFSNDYYFYLR